jgi:serine/threonine protein kinase
MKPTSPADSIAADSLPSFDGQPADPREQQLADLLASMTDEVARGKLVDLQQICLQYPHLAADIRGLWGAVLVTDVAGSDRRDPSRTNDSHATGIGREAIFSLPRPMNHYLLLEEVGRGGMGVVFRARDQNLQREVAIKMILRDQLASDADRQRFGVEALAAAQLEHPNIVSVFEYGQFEGRPYLSMKFIDGPTLNELISRGPLPQRQAALLISQVAHAVAHAHRQGILHRDLKPSNILIDRAGVPHVTDFGLAKQTSDADDHLTRTGAVVGTPSYMSPEQASAQHELIGPCSDVYSLGCVLYHALTGQPPLVANSPVELVMKVIEQDPIPPRQINGRIDRDLEMIVVRCLQKPTDLRYESAADLAADLEAFLRDEPVAARSGRFGQVIARLFRDTHHAPVLENWGLLWMWHSLVLLVASISTWILEWKQVADRTHYAAMWTIGLGTWAAVFWMLRRAMGPVTFIERQIAHIWAASMVAIGMLFPMELWLGLEPLALSPMLGVIAAMVFIVKAGMLSGTFYLQVVALLVTSALMAFLPHHAHLIFGIVAAACFFFPGLKYYRLRKGKQ